MDPDNELGWFLVVGRRVGGAIRGCLVHAQREDLHSGNGQRHSTGHAVDHVRIEPRYALPFHILDQELRDRWRLSDDCQHRRTGLQWQFHHSTRSPGGFRNRWLESEKQVVRDRPPVRQGLRARQREQHLRHDLDRLGPAQSELVISGKRARLFARSLPRRTPYPETDRVPLLSSGLWTTTLTGPVASGSRRE